jgi:hypothetical protein
MWNRKPSNLATDKKDIRNYAECDCTHDMGLHNYVKLKIYINHQKTAVDEDSFTLRSKHASEIGVVKQIAMTTTITKCFLHSLSILAN